MKATVSTVAFLSAINPSADYPLTCAIKASAHPLMF